MTVSFIREVVVKNGVAVIHMTRGYEAIVDAADIGLIDKWNWFPLVVTKNNIYATRNRLVSECAGSKVILLHRVICQPPTGCGVDHINGNGLDNRRSNLRVASQSQNMMNTRGRKDNTSGTRGVFWDKFANKWMAAIGHNGKFYNLGRYDNKEDAADAYSREAKKRFGQFMRQSHE